MSTIRIEQIGKRFGKLTALQDVSIDVGEREVLTIVGPSGCGKSTLLRIIAGLDAPTSGRILMDGVPVTDAPPRERNVAMVFQSYALYPHLTCFENLALNLRLKKIPAGEVRRRVQQTAAMLEISDLLEKRPRELSGGQRQRVAVGRALIRNPRVFLLDEPLSNLDALLRERVRHELKALFRQVEAPVIYVTHDQTEAMTLGDRMAVLDRGRLQQLGAPEELYRHPANRFVASFIGAPSMNLFERELQNGRFSLGGVFLNTGLPFSGAATVGIRPNALRMGDGTDRLQRAKASVEWVESLGSHFLIGVRMDGDVLTLLSDQRPAANRIAVSIDEEHIHVFHKDTGENLARRDPAGFPAGGDRVVLRQ